MCIRDSIYTANASVYAEEIANLYSVNVVLFDRNMDVIGTTLSDMDYTSYKIYAGKVYEAASQAYVVTKIGTQDYIIFFSPIIVNNQTVGVSAFFENIYQINSLVRRMLNLFIYLGARCV